MVTKEGKEPNEICGYATIPDIDSEPGRLAVYFPDVPVAGDYRVLDTDYENWAAVYSCSEWDLFGLFKYSYLLTRSQTRNETAVSASATKMQPSKKIFPHHDDFRFLRPNKFSPVNMCQWTTLWSFQVDQTAHTKSQIRAVKIKSSAFIFIALENTHFR